MMNWVAPAALLVALGATDDELQPALDILDQARPPATITATVVTARDALELVRIQRAGGA